MKAIYLTLLFCGVFIFLLSQEVHPADTFPVFDADDPGVDLKSIDVKLEQGLLTWMMTSHQPWKDPAKDMYIVTHINSDRDTHTGDPEDEGVDYLTHVGSLNGKFVANLVTTHLVPLAICVRSESDT